MRKINSLLAWFTGVALIVAGAAFVVIAAWLISHSRSVVKPPMRETSVVLEGPHVPMVVYPQDEAFYSYQSGVGSAGMLVTRNIVNPDLFTAYILQNDGHLEVLLRFRREQLK